MDTDNLLSADQFAEFACRSPRHRGFEEFRNNRRDNAAAITTGIRVAARGLAGAASFGPSVKLIVVAAEVAEMLSTGVALAIGARASARSAMPARSPFLIREPTIRRSPIGGN